MCYPTSATASLPRNAWFSTFFTKRSESAATATCRRRCCGDVSASTSISVPKSCRRCWRGSARANSSSPGCAGGALYLLGEQRAVARRCAAQADEPRARPQAVRHARDDRDTGARLDGRNELERPESAARDE